MLCCVCAHRFVKPTGLRFLLTYADNFATAYVDAWGWPRPCMRPLLHPLASAGCWCRAPYAKHYNRQTCTFRTRTHVRTARQTLQTDMHNTHTCSTHARRSAQRAKHYTARQTLQQTDTHNTHTRRTHTRTHTHMPNTTTDRHAQAHAYAHHTHAHTHARG
jgi:hypothetical protein